LGKELKIEKGQEAARWATLNALSALKDYFGNLNRVIQIIRAVGYIQASEDFTEHAQVMNGASNLLAEVFGDQGRHARLALGVSSLPKNAAIELELILEIKP
jgi:enamine deaminase RidA (YjgF/YER057c/UK114 family)